MSSKMISPIIFLLYSLFFLQCLQITTSDHINHLGLRGDDDHDNNNHNTKLDDDHKSIILSDHQHPELNVFFHYNTLKIGTQLPIYFPTKDPSKSPHLLSRQESNSIPFSTSEFHQILKILKFSESSKQALAMKSTLHHCESSPIKGETKFCATSLESMLDSVSSTFGSNSNFKVLTTNDLCDQSIISSSPPLQNYTVIETPVEITARKIAACHTLPYPYVVFYCHSQERDTKLYKVLLAGENGGRVVEAVAICHMDTSQWDPHHVAFRVMGTGPGGPPVCHFFPADNLVWIQMAN